MSTRLFLAALLFCTGCATPGFDIDKALSTAKNLHQATADFTEPQEITLGQGIASNLLGSAPLLDSPPVQQYINQVGRWLALQTERPDLPWQFAVLDDKGINAFAAPGGYIFITKGLLLRMKTEAELAGVLAHEISHVLKKHHLQAIKKGARTNLMADFAGEALQQQGVNPALTKLVSAGTEIYVRGLDKDDEFEADRMGVVIAARGGYDPYGLPAVLQILQGINAQDSSLALMFKTHPALADRLGLLDKLMAGPLDRFETQPDLAARFRAAMDEGGLKVKAVRK
ncbi:MAG: M48 family metalloprotease [Gallionellaceae bacterium]|nr:M48 family metalloprotease [Gallionellaceae bacterium]